MKSRLLALSVVALAIGQAQGAVVYQKDGTKLSMSGSLRLYLAKNTESRFDLLNNQSRIWLNVSQNIGDSDWQFFGATQIRPQTQYDDNFSSGVYVHRLFAGIKNRNIGELSFGNLYTMGNYFKLADFTAKFGGVTPSGVLSPGVERTGGLGTYRTFGRVQYGLSTSAKKGIAFRSVAWNGLSFGANYAFPRNGAAYYWVDKNGKLKDNYNNDGYQAGLFFKRQFDDLVVKSNLVYGYSKVDRVNGGPYKGSHYNTRSYGLAFGLTYQDLSFGVDYIHDKSTGGDDFKFKNNSQTSWQLGLKYQLTQPWDIYTAYRQTKYMVGDDVPKKNNEAQPKDFYYVRNKGYALGSNYWLTRSVRVFIEYATNKPNGDKKYPDRQHGYYTGFRVNF